MRSINRGRLLLSLAMPFIALAAHATAPGISPGKQLARAGIKSDSVLVIDQSDSSVLLSRKADVAAPVASITKLMSALVVLDAKQPLDEMLEITQADRDIERGRRSRLAVGAKLSRGDLLHVALMSSENRAANAVGRNYPGGLQGLVRAMNAKAKALGMKHARFVDATGLSGGNLASPNDLVKLVTATAANPAIRTYSTDREHTVLVRNIATEFHNTNSLVSKEDWDISVQKTGYTDAAGQCLVMKASIQNRPIVIVLLNSFGKYTRVADARRIRKWMEAQPAESQLANSAH
jgi:serine-type D-Ala-D-Ala endopeptidase (penicillin-binding protein 7)